MKYEGLIIKGITKTVKDYMTSSGMGGHMIYDIKSGEIEYIDAFYNSIRYRNYYGYYEDGQTYYDDEKTLIGIDSWELNKAEEDAIAQNEGRVLGYSEISKIIKNQIVKQVKAI